jgi:hypothetical protein
MGAFEHYGNGKIKLYGGNDIPIVSNVVDAVGDVFDKADNWTEQVGEDLAKIDPGPAIGDIGESFDKQVLQQVDAGTVLTIAAIVTQQYYLIPYIAAANTAIKGGKLEDIAMSFAVAYVAGEVAPGLNESFGGGFTGAVGTGATIGAGSGATTAVVKGKSVEEGATKGAVTGAVVGGTTYGVSQGYDLAKSELGFGQTSAPSIQQDADFSAAQAESLKNQPGGVSDKYMAEVLTREGMDPFVAQDVATLTNQGIGPEAVSQNIAGTYKAGEVYPVKTVDTNLEKAGKKIVSKAVSQGILGEIFGTPDMSSSTYTRRGSGVAGEDTFLGGEGTPQGNLAPLVQAKYELKKFANPTGDSRLIPFKDDEPQAPIPPGYSEVETVGVAKGGLIDVLPSTMVKYSKKPLVANRKTLKKPKELATTRKGLGVKK